MVAALGGSEEEVTSLRANFAKPDTELAMVVTVLAERPKNTEEEARPPAQVAEYRGYLWEASAIDEMIHYWQKTERVSPLHRGTLPLHAMEEFIAEVC